MEFNQTCYISSPHSKSVREQHFCVRPSFCASDVRLSVTLSSPKPPCRWNSTKLATSLPLMVKVCESNIIFSVRSSVRASVIRPSVINSPEARKYFSQSVILFFQAKGQYFSILWYFYEFQLSSTAPGTFPSAIIVNISAYAFQTNICSVFDIDRLLDQHLKQVYF